MGTFQPVVQERVEQFGVVGSRTGSGHRPARHFHAALAIAQLDDVTYTFDAATVYTTSVDGISVVVDGADVADLAALVDAKIAAINAHPQISQIVAATLLSAGIMRLRARTPGTAFTTLATEAGGGGAGTPATTVANVAGTALDSGDPVFQDAAATNPRLVAVAAAVTDIFKGMVQFRHRAGDLQNTPAGSTYAAGEQIPVDPDGPHIVAPETDVAPGDDVFVSTATNGWSNGSGQAAQVERVTATGATNDKLYSIVLRDLQTLQAHVIDFTADASATVTEIRDGLIARINGLPIPWTAAVGAGADDLDITADVATNNFVVDEVDAELTVANQVAYALIRIAPGQWLTNTTSGNKGEVTFDVP
jgi:hypothetical protein